MAAQHARIRLTNRKIPARSLPVKSMRSLQGPTHVLETYMYVFLREHVMASALKRNILDTLKNSPERARTACHLNASCVRCGLRGFLLFSMRSRHLEHLECSHYTLASHPGPGS